MKYTQIILKSIIDHSLVSFALKSGNSFIPIFQQWVFNISLEAYMQNQNFYLLTDILSSKETSLDMFPFIFNQLNLLFLCFS